MTTQLTEHFTLEELCASTTATRMGINNIPDDAGVIDNLRSLCAHVLEPVRNHYGIAFSPNSGYRCSALNAALNSSPKSQHRAGQAADIEVPGVDNFELAEWIEANCTYDQLISEKYEAGVPDSGWVHVSYVRPPDVNRRDSMTFDGKTYRSGLIK